MISIKIDGKNIEFSDWKSAGREYGPEDLIKESNDFMDEIYLLKFYWGLAGHYWSVTFCGPNVNCLQKVYYELYPLETNKFLIYQVEREEAKSHVDKFLKQIPVLLPFI